MFQPVRSPTLSGDVSVQGSSVIFTGQAGDVDIPVTDLQFEWLSDKDGVLGTGAIDSSGELHLPIKDSVSIPTRFL